MSSRSEVLPSRRVEMAGKPSLARARAKLAMSDVAVWPREDFDCSSRVGAVADAAAGGGIPRPRNGLTLVGYFRSTRALSTSISLTTSNAARSNTPRAEHLFSVGMASRAPPDGRCEMNEV